MNVLYNDRTDSIYIRLDEKKQEVINRRISEDVVLGIGEGKNLSVIEILGKFISELGEGQKGLADIFKERCPSWPKEHDWKSCVYSKGVPRVRIPLSPP